ncbi:hypothetical protein [Shewanella glacialipiscicola]|uniref:hypothetical protein n=1 Tax=Shewanella glacialipiscicola TaxID=614069 RepID=UPI003D7B7BA3
MARNKSIQVACEPKLYDKIIAYRKENKISSDANAMRELTLIGLNSLGVKRATNQPSDRDLLESILLHVTKKGGDELVSLD